MDGSRLRGLLTRLRPVLPRTWSAVLLTSFAALFALVGLVGLIAHYRTPGRAWVLGISAFSPYLMLGAPVAVILLCFSRQWIAAIVAVALTACCVATQVPLYGSTTAPAAGHAFVTMTSNLRIGGANADAVVAAVRRHQADALMLEELTADEQRRLVAAGLDEVLPFHISAPAHNAQGTGLWSRYPLTHESERHDFFFNFVSATVRIPGLATTPRLVALHMSGPWPNSIFWQIDIGHLHTVLAELATGTVVVGGDFNATPDVRQFRALLTHGYADGAAQAGAGMTRTYPSNKWFPPLLAIDHVLTRHAVATTAETIEIPGSDHRALVVTVSLPADESPAAR